MNNTFGTIFLCSLILSVCILACDDPDPIDTNRGEGYFPLYIGRTLEYKVDSIIFDDAGSTNTLDTFTSFVRERVLDAYENAEGDSVFRIQRDYRRSADIGWTPVQLWTASRNTFEAVRSEDNQRLLKMEFPLYEGRTWNPTKYINTLINIPVGTESINMYSYWRGKVLAIDQPDQVGALDFTQVMTCIQADDDNELERRYILEKYAQDVGLIFRMDTIVDSRCERLGEFGPCVGMNWMQKGEKGYIMRLELISYY